MEQVHRLQKICVNIVLEGYVFFFFFSLFFKKSMNCFLPTYLALNLFLRTADRSQEISRNYSL